jgi:fatty acid desaturase
MRQPIWQKYLHLLAQVTGCERAVNGLRWKAAGKHRLEAARQSEKELTMALGLSLVLVAVGAILRYAYTPTTTHGWNVGMTGVILMIVGIVGAVFSIVQWTMRNYSHSRTTSTVQANGQVVRRDDIDTTQRPV